MKRLALLLLYCAPATLLLVSVIVQTSAQAIHAPSGGTQTMVISIWVPPLPHAPFAATVRTKWKRTLDDGSVVEIMNHRIVARDDRGRIFQERRNFYPEGDVRDSEIRQLEFSDPEAHTIYYCWPVSRSCELYDYRVRAVGPSSVPTGPLDGGKEFLTRVDLGKDSVENIEAIGTRETTTINAGVIGNDRAVSVVKEFWYAPQLGINLIEERRDPRYGAQTFIVNEISLGEPDARLFDVPADSHIVDRRQPSR